MARSAPHSAGGRSGTALRCLSAAFLLPAVFCVTAGAQAISPAEQGTAAGRTSTTGTPQSTAIQSSGEAAPRPVSGPTQSRSQTVSTLASAVSGSIPADKSELPPDGKLTLEKAVELALAHNLAILVGGAQVDQSKGLSAQSRAALLPNVEAGASQQRLSVNLAAQGFEPGLFPGLSSTLIGPFNRFDARVSLVQSIFNLAAIRDYQAGKSGVKVADLQVALARQQVFEATALAYLDVLAAERSVAQARANLDLAEQLFKLAQDQHTAGVATGLDVTRAETRVAQERVRVARSRTAVDQAYSRLDRVVGIPQDATITLADPLQFTPEALPPVAALVPEALNSRVEVRIADEELRRNELERRSVEAEQYPSVDFAADYGASGNTPVQNDLQTHGVAVRLNVPIFNGGLTRGRVAVAKSLERQAELQLGDIRGAVEQDVRLAVLAEATAAEEVTAADQQVVLAERQVRMARDRFAAGVASNIEVTEAQTALADARQSQVEALARYTAARIEVAAARGVVERFRW